MKIIIYQNREVYKEESKIGNDSENKVETLEFEFPEEYEDFTKYIEFQIKGEKYTDIIENNKYEITRAIAKQGKIKTQVVLRKSIENDVLVFKSNVFELNVSKSINATENIPDEYPTWADNLTTLKQNLEKSEQERVTSEEARIEAETQREETFTQMEQSVEDAVKEIADKKADYNQNALEKTNEYNELTEQKTNAFNSNTEIKTNNFNQNYTEKTTVFDTDVTTKMNEFNTNATNKTTEFNNNAKSKTETFNSIVEQKETELENLAEEKINEYNQVSAELTAKVEQVQAENESLKAENKLIKEQIPSASASGNSVHIEDSGTLDFDWKIKGGHKQDGEPTPEDPVEIKTVGSNKNFVNMEDVEEKNSNGMVYNIKNNVLTIKGTATANTTLIFNSKISVGLKANTYTLNANKNGSLTGVFGYYIYGSTAQSSARKILIDGGNLASSTNTGIKTQALTENNYYDCCFGIYFAKNFTTDMTLMPKLEKGSVATPYSSYNQGSVEINITNKNLLPKTTKTTQSINGITFTINNDGTIKANGTATARTTLYLGNSVTLNSGTYTISSGLNGVSNVRFGLEVGSSYLNTNNSRTDTFDSEAFVKNSYFQIDSGVTVNNLVLKPMVEIGSTATGFVEHQSQAFIMPIQQEMLDGDYISDVEHHNWRKIILTGEENIAYYDAPSTEIANNLDTAYFTIGISEKAQGNLNNIISNMFKNLYTASAIWGNASSTSETLKESISVDSAIRLRINKDRLEGYENSLTGNEKITLLKTYIKSKYEAGTPVIVYYKLATPVDLELTSEQKAVRETKLNTYKNITNINLSDELASIDIEYKKDQDTINKNYENRLAALESASIS